MHTNIKVPQEIKMYDMFNWAAIRKQGSTFSKATTKSRFMGLYSGKYSFNYSETRPVK